ncbi:regulatory protein RecX [Cytophagaceae bacterium ABcell3]|nr:regulatory protein RecX [Cytophagaceae bacterium ABcell3]
MTFHKKQKVLSKNDVLQKILKYCTWRERSMHEVHTKLKQYALKANDIEEIISFISDEGFVNDERFSKIYAGSKFRLSKWGKNKIKAGLFAKGVSGTLAENAINEEIEKEEYYLCLKELYQKKQAEVALKEGLSAIDIKNRVFRYLLGKGYEMELIYEVEKEL